MTPFYVTSHIKSLVVAMHMMMKITSSAKVAVLLESTSELVDLGWIADGVFAFVWIRRQRHEVEGN